MTPQKLCDLLIELNPRWNASGELVACVNLNQQSHDIILKADACGLIDRIKVKGDKAYRSVTEIASSMYGIKDIICVIKIGANDVVPVYRTIADLADKLPVNPPSQFVIFESKQSFTLCDQNDKSFAPKNEIKHYLEIAKFWQSLKDNSDDSTTQSITFLYRHKTRLLAKYDTSVLTNEYGGLSRYQRILEELSDESHKGAKSHILQNVLLNILYHIPENQRFEHLLNCFESFTTKFDDAYHAYVVGFSFDDLRKEYEERYREYMVKINDLISSSLMKALMIPGALYLTATRTQAIQTSKDLSHGLEATIVNFGIGVAAIFVCMIYWFILCNEKKSLTSIEDEFGSLMRRLEEKSPKANNSIKKFRDNIDNRLRLGFRAISILSVGNIIAVFASLVWVLVRFIPPSILNSM